MNAKTRQRVPNSRTAAHSHDNTLNYLAQNTSFVKERAFRASLTTHGRKTGTEHTVLLRAVQYNDRVYFSRRNAESDWLKNALANPKVTVGFDGTTHSGVASLVTDEPLAKKISELKYPGEQRAQEARIVLQVILE